MGNIVIQTPPTPTNTTDWGNLGGYFSTTFSSPTADPQSAETYSWSNERYQDLSARFQKISEEYDIVAETQCMPAREAVLIANRPENSTPLTPEQALSVRLTSTLASAQIGETILNQVAENDAVMCVLHDRLGEWRAAGAYFLEHKMISIDSAQLGKDAEVYNSIGALKNNKEAYAKFLDTFIEEVAHGAQDAMGKLDFKKEGAPEKNNTEEFEDEDLCAVKPDFIPQVLSEMYVEAHAKVVRASILMKIPDQEILDSLLKGEGQGAEILRAVKHAYDEYGEDQIRQDPGLLLPAYQAFFEHDEFYASFEASRHFKLGGFHGQLDFCTRFIKNIEAMGPEQSQYNMKKFQLENVNFEGVDIDEIIAGFGNIPHHEGNALSSLRDLSGGDLDVFLGKGTELGRFFNVVAEYINSEPEPSEPTLAEPVPTEKVDIPGMSN